MKTTFLAVSLLFICNLCVAGIPVIPLPQQCLAGSGELRFSENITIQYLNHQLLSEAAYLSKQLDNAGVRTTIYYGEGVTATPSVVLRIDDKSSSPEKYLLEITPSGATITGGGTEGVFYGISSLIQIIESSKGVIPCVTINDEPRFGWRGFMLDEARHFFGKEKVLQILDLMARFKLNKLHWHLSDSEGWRVEIKQYPLLTEVGGRGSWSQPETGPALFYTQDEIREIIQYAAERHIEIIPEIDMPGHANAAVRSYPFLSAGASKEHGEFTYNPGKEETYEFLANVLREVAALFPGQYLNIGGDEVAYGIESWNTDPDVQRLMKDNGFANLRDAEKYFADRMGDSVRNMGKKIIAWEEAVELGTDANTTILWWRQNKPEVLDKTLRDGHKTILCPRLPCYLDFIQDPDHKWGRVWIKDFNRLQDVYRFPDEQLDIPALPNNNNIIGIQANLWTERVPIAKRLDYMMWPRLCALAETAWTQPSNKSFECFEKRLDAVYLHLDSIGIHYYDHRDPSRHPEVPGREKGEKSPEGPANFID